MPKDSKKIFGLWIDDFRMCAVEIFKGKFGVRIVNYSTVELEPEVIENGCIVVNPDALKTAVNKLLLEGANGPITARNAVIALPEEKTFSHILEIPKDKAKDKEYIMETAGDLIPIELDEAATDYSTLKESANGRTVTMNFVAAQANIINPIIVTLKEIGVNVIGVDISSNCMIRACNNPYNPNSEAFLIASLNLEETSLSIGSVEGDTFSVSIPMGGKELAEKIKSILNVATSSEAKNAIKCVKKGDPVSLNEDQKKEIEVALSDYFTKIKSKIKNLTKAMDSEKSYEVKAIYPTGCFNQVPGFEKTLQAVFPNAEIKNKLEYLQNEEINEHCYIEAIGLALKAYIEDGKNDLNLLPQAKQEELKVAEILPKLKRYLIEISLLLSASMLLSGMYLAKTFVDFKVSEQKTIILNEKALNPYLTEMVKTEQQKQQKTNQVLEIVKKSLPVSKMIGDLDALNDDSIAMINIAFNTNETTDKNQVRLRAKASSRAETELFVAQLGEIDYFSEIISPLSNLVGKGDRFISVDLSVDSEKLTNSYRAGLEKERQDMLNESEDSSAPKASPKMTKTETSIATDPNGGEQPIVKNEEIVVPNNPTTSQ